jgi:hypothetical protein
MRWNYQNIACNFYFQLERGPRPFRSTGVHPGFSAVRVARSLFFCVVYMFCISLFVLFLFHLAIVSSVLLRFNDYEHYVTPLFGIFKLLTLYKMGTIWEKKSNVKRMMRSKNLLFGRGYIFHKMIRHFQIQNVYWIKHGRFWSNPSNTQKTK